MMTLLKTKTSLLSGVISGVVLMMGAPQLAAAQTSPELTGLLACQSISNAEAQLACFQIEAAKLRGTPAPAPALAPAVIAAPSPAPAPTPAPVVPRVVTPAPSPAVVGPSAAESLAAEKESLALQQKNLAAERERLAAEEKRLTALRKDTEAKSKAEKKAKAPKNRVLAIRDTRVRQGDGFVIFTLENGEVWQQTGPGRVRLGKANPDTLSINKKSLGSFLGKVNDKRPGFKVRRLK